MSEQFFTTGAKKDKKDKRDYRITGILAPIEIPKQKFIIEDVFESKNQDGRGSCTAQAQAHHKERQEGKKLSARFVMAKSKELEGNNGYGGYARNSFKVVNDVGICSEELFPEPAVMTWDEYIDVSKIPANAYADANNHKSKSYWSLRKDIDEIRNTLITYKNSVNMSMAWYKVFNNPVNGVLSTEFSGEYSGHEIDIKGFDDFNQWLICKNSWGEGWGDKGDFKIPYDMLNKLAWDLWCSLDLPQELPVDNYYGGQRTWAGYLREKAMGLNPWLLGKIGRLPTRREIIGLAYGFWEWEVVFRGKYGDLWLKMTKPEAKKQGLI